MEAIAVQNFIDDNLERSGAAMDFIEAYAETPVEWGVSDCSMWPANWAATKLGRALDVPHYADEAGARALIDEAGGLASLWAHICARNGIPPVNGGVQAGDIGVIHTYTLGDVGCIFVKYGTVAVIRCDPGYRMIGIRPQYIVGAWRP